MSDGKVRMIPDESERFGLIKVEYDGKSTYFVKNALNNDGFFYLRREIQCWQHLAALGVLNANLPHLYASDATVGVIVTECIDPCLSLNEAVLHHPELLGQAVFEASKITAKLHTLPATEMEIKLNRELPWIFGLFRKPSAWRPPSFYKVLPLIKDQSSVKAGLTFATTLWLPLNFIHGDIKWENFLLRDVDESLKKMRLVDWELAGIGDLSWDLAGIINELLMNEAYTQKSNYKDHTDDRYQYVLFETVRTFTRGLREIYTQIAEKPFTREFGEKLILFTALRLLQSAFEMAVVKTVSQNDVAVPIRIAECIFRDPGIAALMFL